jgi:cytochrome c biogenesis protein CcdA
MADVSLSIAFVGGGLATLNPCGFRLLPAFLSF